MREQVHNPALGGGAPCCQGPFPTALSVLGRATLFLLKWEHPGPAGAGGGTIPRKISQLKGAPGISQRRMAQVAGI